MELLVTLIFLYISICNDWYEPSEIKAILSWYGILLIVLLFITHSLLIAGSVATYHNLAIRIAFVKFRLMSAHSQVTTNETAI